MGASGASAHFDDRLRRCDDATGCVGVGGAAQPISKPRSIMKSKLRGSAARFEPKRNIPKKGRNNRDYHHASASFSPPKHEHGEEISGEFHSPPPNKWNYSGLPMEVESTGNKLESRRSVLGAHCSECGSRYPMPDGPASWQCPDCKCFNAIDLRWQA